MHDVEALSRLQYGSPFLEQKKGQLYADIWARPRNQALLAFDPARKKHALIKMTISSVAANVASQEFQVSKVES